MSSAAGTFGAIPRPNIQNIPKESLDSDTSEADQMSQEARDNADFLSQDSMPSEESLNQSTMDQEKAAATDYTKTALKQAALKTAKRIAARVILGNPIVWVVIIIVIVIIVMIVAVAQYVQGLEDFDLSTWAGTAECTVSDALGGESTLSCLLDKSKDDMAKRVREDKD